MNRTEFMSQLEKLLYDISTSERQEALDYYNSYFDDAGQENESRVIQELGSPGKVAAIIKADLSEDSGEYGEYTENGYQDSRTGNGKVPDVYTAKQSGDAHQSQNQNQRSNSYQNRAQRGYQAPQKKNSTGNLILIIAIIVLSCWIWMPLAVGILGVLIGVIACFVAAIICVAIFALCGIICGVMFGIVGVVQCVTSPGLGLLEISMGFISLAAGILLALAFAWIVVKFLPWLFRSVVELCQRLLHRKKKGAEA